MSNRTSLLPLSLPALPPSNPRVDVQRPAHLRRLRGDLQEARHVAPLFDTVRAVRNLEIALRLMWEAHAAGVRGGGGRERPHLVSGDVGPISGRSAAGGQARDALEQRLFGMRVETSQVEKV